ncbi:LysR family transcriptional regulator [Brytella acorum]|uniref:LysR family transcriptional regulator n=1 Tax=Brytella acorum TaxID=2959299 RepID=A0AA35Y423_9PROT|nr:LysR family transcriptional regulator [Brytella acorum]CAI9121406.1 LysR family transcriptional regulator [Brytella acorum]
MDRIDVLRIFVRVVETRSFTRAADSLQMPRSTVSSAIQTLEARMGTRLLARTTRSVSPTPNGSIFHTHCLRLIADMDEAERLFLDEASHVTGLVRVDLPGRIGRLIVCPALPEFLERHPDIEVELGMSDRVVNLVENAIDCVLRVGPLEDSSLVVRKLGELTLINVASPAYLARHGMPRSPNDLPEHVAVRYASPSTGRIEDWEWMDGDTPRRVLMRGRVTVNSAEALIACAIAGLGLIQIPAYDVRDQLQAGTLVEVLGAWRSEALPISLLYPHRQHLSRRVRLFSDWLENVLRAWL